MKKILSMGIIALVALVATTFVSCSSSSNEEEDNFTFNCKITSAAKVTTNVLNAVTSAYQSIVASKATVKSTGEDTFTINCKESDKTAVWEAIENTNMSGLRTTLDDLFTISSANIFVYQGETSSLTYFYEMTPEKLLIGTFKGTVDGKDIEWTMSKKLSDSQYETKVVYEGTTYTGIAKYNQENDHLTFDSDDDTLSLESLLDIYGSFEGGVTVFDINVDVPNHLYTDIKLTRQ